MSWILIGIAATLFIARIILRVVLAIPLGVLNMLWIIALLTVILWGARRFA